MSDPKNRAEQDERERSKSDGTLNEGGEGQPVEGRDPEEIKNDDQSGGGSAGDDAGDDDE